MYLTARINDQLGFNRPEKYIEISYGQLGSCPKTVETGKQIVGYDWLSPLDRPSFTIFADQLPTFDA